MGIALNEDNSHFYFTRPGQPVTLGTVDALVDQYAGTQVSRLLFCPNCMRASYASRVWDPIWRGYDPQGPDDQPLLASLPAGERAGARGWIHTAWAFDQAGIDVYARWIERSRRHGISPWLSMRMNDTHNVGDERNFLHSEFWRAHPELRRVSYRTRASAGANRNTDRGFDYGRAEVREYHFRLIEELAERYDFDGLELDWSRRFFCFRPGHEGEGAGLLTAFTERVRRLLDGWAKRRGHGIRLGARVPSRPTTAIGLGMDAVTWARRGLIDWLVVTPYFATIEPDMPVELWRQLLGGSGVELLAGLEVHLQNWPGLKRFPPNSLETVRGAAVALLHRGADGIYLFNYMDSPAPGDWHDSYPRLLRELGDLAVMAGQPRRHVLTYTDTWAVGEPPAYPLPVKVGADAWQTFRIPIGPRPTGGAAEVVLALEPAGGITGAAAQVRVNGEPCGPAEAAMLPAPAPDEPAWRYRLPVKALRDGYNVIEVHAQAALTVTWVEIALDPAARAPRDGVGAAVAGVAAAGELWTHPAAQPLATPQGGPFLELPDGSLMTIDPQGFRTSRDEGVTWSEAIPVADGIPAASSEHAVVRTRSGALVMLYLDMGKDVWRFTWDSATGEPKEDCKLEIWAIRSLDDGQTWGDKQLVLEGYNAEFFGFLQTHGGRLVASVEHLVTRPGRWVTLSLFSDDDGKTWQRSNLIDLGGRGHHDGALEPTMAELSDGRLLMLIRTNYDRFWQAFSDDGGRYWRSLGPTAINASTSPGKLLRLHSGRLALLYNQTGPAGTGPARPACRPLNALGERRSEAMEVPSSWYREELVLSFSEDDGRSWTEPVVVARLPGGQLSYPYLFERRPGELWLSVDNACKKGWQDPVPFRIKVNEADIPNHPTPRDPQ